MTKLKTCFFTRSMETRTQSFITSLLTSFSTYRGSAVFPSVFSPDDASVVVICLNTNRSTGAGSRVGAGGSDGALVQEKSFPFCSKIAEKIF